MTAVVEVRGLGKTFGRFPALQDVTFTVEENAVCGLLGRNGAGKTTAMQIVAGHALPGTGDVRVFGADPFENEKVLGRTCFVKEGLRYPDVSVRAALNAARLLYPGWDEELARALVDDFGLPLGRRCCKLSRGMLSAVGIVIGLASRAPLTFFDEPYLGLDAVARQLFYDRLLADYAERPRTIVLSTHLIDEISELITDVVLLDRGRVLLTCDTETLRRRAVTLTGPGATVDRIAAGHDELHREQLAGTTRVTLSGAVDRDAAAAAGLDVEPVSLQQLVVRLTTAGAGPREPADAAGTTVLEAHR